MLNHLILVGRLVRNIEIMETESGRKVGRLTLAVARSYKNMDGVYETDFIPCTLWEEKAKIAANYCQKGDILGIKGRLQTRLVETKDGSRTVLEVIAERLSFISSRKDSLDKMEEEEEEKITN